MSRITECPKSAQVLQECKNAKLGVPVLCRSLPKMPKFMPSKNQANYISIEGRHKCYPKYDFYSTEAAEANAVGILEEF